MLFGKLFGRPTGERRQTGKVPAAPK